MMAGMAGTHDDEQVMAGGVNVVTRIGDTVRRPTGSWTPAVHALLAYLKARGFQGSPGVHGFDEQGREVVDFVEGDVLDYPLPDQIVADEALRSVGELLRDYHEATLGFVSPPDAVWYFEAREPAEVLCHGDFAPHNMVFRDGRAAAVIDFDTAHPGPRAWDFAWTAFCFGLSTMDGDLDAADAGAGAPLPERIHRVRVLADAYGLSAEDRKVLPDVTIARLRHLVAHIREQAAAGHPGFSTHLAEGHDIGYLTAVEAIDGYREVLVSALL
jgi:hypothetical protein